VKSGKVFRLVNRYRLRAGIAPQVADGLANRFPYEECRSVSNLGRPVILVVDADPLALTASSAVLHCAGYEVHCAASREAALRGAADLEVDLIICDLDIGGIEGSAIIEEIRRIPERRDVVVMYASACQQPEVIRKSQAGGGVYHLRKPFDAPVLLGLVEKALWLPHLVQSHLHGPHFSFAPTLPMATIDAIQQG
jgi:CheY-like chemotaxis protein